MNPTLDTLRQWSDSGWLRRLDSALAAFVAELDPEAAPVLPVATALLAHMEGRGHTCLPLAPLVRDPVAVLGWPAPAQEALQTFWVTLPRGLPQWLEALRASPVVRQTDQDDDAGQPLVLGGSAEAPLLYLRRYWAYETRVVQALAQRTATPQPVDEAVARRWLDRLFAPPAGAPAAGPGVDWQKLACAMALRSRLSVITGGPGTGKTYTAARLLALLLAVDPQPERLRVALAAPTGKAAARLKQSIDAALEGLQARLGEAVSNHRSDVEDCAPPSDRSARRIPQPIPGVLVRDATQRCDSRASADRHLAGGSTPDLHAFAQRMGAARTLHALLGARPDTRQFRHHAAHPLDVDVLIVDEASMVHLEMMAALLDALPAGARLVLLGDKDQLASVEAGAVLGDLCRDAEAGRYDADTARYALAVAAQALPPECLDASGAAPALARHTVMLRESRRFGGPIGQLALAVNRGDAAGARRVLADDTSGAVQALEDCAAQAVVQLALHGRPGASACYRDYLDAMAQRPEGLDASGHGDWVRSVLTAFERFRLLCAVREGEWGAAGLNRAVEAALRSAGLLEARGEWYAGRPVMVTRNDAALGVFNGDIGIALPSATAGGGLRVYFADGPQLRSVGVARLAQVETAFAMTVHKSQGSEFEHTVLVLPPRAGAVLGRELVYTGITRARQAFTLVAAQPGLLAQAVAQRTQRASGLRARLDAWTG